MKHSNSILEMLNISKSFPGVKALADVSFNVKRGSVHALMGENGAGKSTLMKCLFGIYARDEGNVLIDGENQSFHSTRDALSKGVSMVHQELNLVTQTRVVDNIWLGRFPTKYGMVDEKYIYNETLKIFEDFEINIDPFSKVSQLSISQMQMIEIAKAVSYNARIIVMDEPSSSLTEKEVSHLFRIIKKLQSADCAIIYISHKMDEIEKIADEITIMRDGKVVATDALENLSMDKIISLMVGREMNERFPERTNEMGEVILKVESMSGPTIDDINFDLRKGEVLGIAGLMGAKRSDVLETLFGVRHRHTGTITLHNKILSNHHPYQAIKNGFSLVTEERRKTGIFPTASVSFNSLVASWKKNALDKFKVLNNTRIKEKTNWVISSMNVKTPSRKTQIKFLSGGNQQKVILGRWLLSDPDILLLDEPTRGIDVGAKFEIYRLINDLVSKNKGIIMVSSEMPELFGTTDRILVMSNGKIAGIVNTSETSQEEVLRLAAKYI